MKVAQNNETNPDTQPVRPPRIPNLSNSQLSPSGSSVRKHETPGILSRMFPPLRRYHLLPRLGTPSITLCHVMHLFALYSLFLPPLLSGRLRDRRRCWCLDRLRCCRPLLLARATRQASPLDHPISPIPSLYSLH